MGEEEAKRNAERKKHVNISKCYLTTYVKFQNIVAQLVFKRELIFNYPEKSMEMKWLILMQAKLILSYCMPVIALSNISQNLVHEILCILILAQKEKPSVIKWVFKMLCFLET